MNKELLSTYATICELYIAQDMQIKDIALNLAIDVNHVHRALNAYLSKPEEPGIIAVDSIINNRTAYVLHHLGKIKISEMADDLSVSKSTICEIIRRAGVSGQTRVRSKGWDIAELKTCIILNQETGIYYFNVPDAAKAHNLTRRSMQSYFEGCTDAKRWHKWKRYSLN